jgi:hypothetical protein
MPITYNGPGAFKENVLDILLNQQDSTGPTIVDPRSVKHSYPMSHMDQSPIPTARAAVPTSMDYLLQLLRNQ